MSNVKWWPGKYRCLTAWDPQMKNVIGRVEERVLKRKIDENIMFYPDNQKPVYRIVLPKTAVERCE